MDVLVCVKRVPVTGGRISLTDDEQDIDTRYLGFTVSPHEECAVEEAVRLVEATAGAIARVIAGDRDAGAAYDLLLFGNESADAGGYQVGIRVANLLDMPCVTGVKHLEIRDGRAEARREGPGGIEIFEVPLPAVITVKEGINLPRYPSIPGRLRAKKAPVERLHLEAPQPGLEKVRMRLPQGRDKQVEILGDGAVGIERAVEVLRQIGVMPS